MLLPSLARGEDARCHGARANQLAHRPVKPFQIEEVILLAFGQQNVLPDMMQDAVERKHRLGRLLPGMVEIDALPERPPLPAGLKYKAALSIAYGAGLRGGEVVMLRVGDIDSKRMLIRVKLGKGRKDRHAMLSPQLLELLRAWWLQARPQGWLFPEEERCRGGGSMPLRPR